jgi:hypothetical protein
MTETEFQREALRVKTFLGVGGKDADYWVGYARGLRRGYHGERFGSAAEHAVWMRLADEKDTDQSRRDRGRGYREGLAYATTKGGA